MTAEQQNEINELTQYIRYLESFSSLKIEQYWTSENSEGKSKLAHKIAGMMGVSIKIPPSLRKPTCSDEEYALEKLQAELFLFTSKEIQRAKDKIKEIVG